MNLFFLPRRAPTPLAIGASLLCGAWACAGCVVAPAQPPANPDPGGAPASAMQDSSSPSPSPSADAGAGSIMDAIPFQRWQEVPPRVVGLLYASGAQPWGGSLSHGRGLELGTKRREYKFSFDASSPYALYFESADGRGNNFMRNWSVSLPRGAGSAKGRYNAAMFDPSTPNDLELGAEAHFVELEVNGGRGGTGLHFVATGAQVLDGKDGFPSDPVALLVGARQGFDREVEQLGAELDQVYGSSKDRAKAHPAQGKRTTSEGQAQVGIWPTWLPD